MSQDRRPPPRDPAPPNARPRSPSAILPHRELHIVTVQERLCDQPEGNPTLSAESLQSTGCTDELADSDRPPRRSPFGAVPARRGHRAPDLLVPDPTNKATGPVLESPTDPWVRPRRAVPRQSAIPQSDPSAPTATDLEAPPSLAAAPAPFATALATQTLPATDPEATPAPPAATPTVLPLDSSEEVERLPLNDAPGPGLAPDVAIADSRISMPPRPATEPIVATGIPPRLRFVLAGGGALLLLACVAAVLLARPRHDGPPTGGTDDEASGRAAKARLARAVTTLLGSAPPAALAPEEVRSAPASTPESAREGGEPTSQTGDETATDPPPAATERSTKRPPDPTAARKKPSVRSHKPRGRPRGRHSARTASRPNARRWGPSSVELKDPFASPATRRQR